MTTKVTVFNHGPEPVDIVDELGGGCQGTVLMRVSPGSTGEMHVHGGNQMTVREVICNPPIDDPVMIEPEPDPELPELTIETEEDHG